MKIIKNQFRTQPSVYILCTSCLHNCILKWRLASKLLWWTTLFRDDVSRARLSLVMMAFHPRHPPVVFHCRLKPLLIVEYMFINFCTFILAFIPLNSINIPPTRLLVRPPNPKYFLPSIMEPTTCAVEGIRPNQVHALLPMV